MSRHGLRVLGLGVLAIAGGLAAATPQVLAQTPGLTIPPDLRPPSVATPSELGEKPAAAKPKAKKRAAQAGASRTLDRPKASAQQQVPQRVYPPDLERDDAGGGAQIKPSFNSSGRLGFGGRF
jgi:hypothetical protein